MKEKKDKEKHKKSHKSKKKSVKKERRRSSSSSSTSSGSDAWVEKKVTSKVQEREDWMSMTGKLKTFTKDDMRPKREKDKSNIDSYNPGASSRELNPYWKDGGTGLPQTSDSFRKSRQFLKPNDDIDDDYYSKPKSSYTTTSNSSEISNHRTKKDEYYKYDSYKTYNWKHQTKSNKESNKNEEPQGKIKESIPPVVNKTKEPEQKIENDDKYLSDEKMNKLGAKIIKAEIMGDTKLVADLKAKLEAAREFRKQNPHLGKEENEERVMLISTNSAGNSMPLASSSSGDARSKGGKRKSETHRAGERIKYFGDDDKYNLKEMFQQEKYGSNYNDDAELAKITSKHKNPNDDLEDIFTDEISKNRNEAKDREMEKQRAISQHVKLEKSLEGCEYCIESKNMLKHLMVSCGNKVYMALPVRKSLVPYQCIITTLQHSTCVTAVDEDVWEEILDYRKAITKFFNKQDKDVVFFEMANKLHKYPHLVINCVPLPRDVGDMAAIYFKKALLECEAEWSMNKKVVDLKGKNIRKGIPKGLPYFWIDFGMDPGFAHVIEDQQLFPKTFAEEIIAGFLDLDHSLWKNPKKEYGDVQRKKVMEFVKEWKPFELNNKNS